MAKLPPRFRFVFEPAWVERARTIFDVPYDRDDDHPNVKPDPGDEERYLRQFSIGGAAVAAAMKPRQYLQMAERHFSVIEAAGLHIPDREYHLDGTGYFSPPRQARLYTSIAKVHGERLLDMQEPQKRLHASQVFNSLHAYQRWARDTGERFVLADINYTRQYHWGKTASDEGDRLYWHDPEPHFLDPTDERDKGFWNLERRLFTAFAEYVGASITDNPMDR